jgi:hypothetical protein
MSNDTPKLPAVRIVAVSATCAENDEALVTSWLDSLGSDHTVVWGRTTPGATSR